MYFITMIDTKKQDTRCVGYFSKFEDAESSVLENAMDICETCYDYAVIENIQEGLYQYDTNTILWYKFNEIDEVYEKTKDIPKGYKNVCGFAIG